MKSPNKKLLSKLSTVFSRYARSLKGDSPEGMVFVFDMKNSRHYGMRVAEQEEVNKEYVTAQAWLADELPAGQHHVLVFSREPHAFGITHLLFDGVKVVNCP